MRIADIVESGRRVDNSDTKPMLKEKLLTLILKIGDQDVVWRGKMTEDEETRMVRTAVAALHRAGEDKTIEIRDESGNNKLTSVSISDEFIRKWRQSEGIHDLSTSQFCEDISGDMMAIYNTTKSRLLDSFSQEITGALKKIHRGKEIDDFDFTVESVSDSPRL